MIAQQTYQCPRCQDTFDVSGRGAELSGCPACGPAIRDGWFYKIDGEVFGPVPLETLRQRLSPSAVSVRPVGQEDWQSADTVPAPGGESVSDAAQDSAGKFESAPAPPPRPRRRYLLPLIAASALLLIVTFGWLYRMATAANPADAKSGPPSRTVSALRKQLNESRARNREISAKMKQLQTDSSDQAFRRRLLVDISDRQAKNYDARIQKLQAGQSRFGRSRRRRFFFQKQQPAPKPPEIAEFRKQLAHKWAKTIAQQRDAVLEKAFYAAEYERVTHSPAKESLVINDRKWFRERGIKYRPKYGDLYTPALQELLLYMKYATPTEIVALAKHSGLSFPPAGKIPAEFAAAIKKAGTTR